MVALDDLGIRYEEITDFQLFMMLTRQLTPDDTSILLGDLNLSEYEPQINTTDGTVRLYNRKNQTIIDEAIYQQIVQFLRRMHDIKRKVIITKTEHDREYMISKDEIDELVRRWPKLDDRSKMLLEGKYILGKSDEVLAEELSIKPASVRMALTRARQCAYRLLIDDSTPGCSK